MGAPLCMKTQSVIRSPDFPGVARDGYRVSAALYAAVSKQSEESDDLAKP